MRRYWPHLSPRVAAHRWAGIAKQRVESIGLSDAPSEVAVFVRAAAEALALSAGQAERGTFARAAAETLALAATHTGGIAAPGINPATDWASRSASAKGVIGAENWSSYADAAAAYNSAGCYGANKNPSQGATFTNAFEIVTDAGHFMPKKHQSILLNLFELESITVDDVMTAHT